MKEQGIKVRYIKLTIYEVPYQQKPCISGLRVFGTGDGEKPQNAEFTVARSENGLDMTVSAKAEQQLDTIFYGDIKRINCITVIWYMEKELQREKNWSTDQRQKLLRAVDTFNENGITEVIQ